MEPSEATRVKSVQGTQMRVLRRIDGVSRIDRVRNEDTYKAGLGGYSRRSKVKTGEVEEQDNKESFKEDLEVEHGEDGLTIFTQ